MQAVGTLFKSDLDPVIERFKQKMNGFSLIELLVTVSVLGILTSIALVNLTSSRTRNKLLETTRELENWLHAQRNYAMAHNITCRVTIDPKNKLLTSTVDSEDNSLPCTKNTYDPNISIFDLSSKLDGEGDKISLFINGLNNQNQMTRVIRFQHQGFNQHHIKNLEGDLEDDDRQDGIFEIRLKHENLNQSRCIRIISPIGMMRDGYADGSAQRCNYENTY